MTQLQTVFLLIQALPTGDKARLGKMFAEAASGPEQDRIVRPAETARILGRSTRAVHMLAAQGVLHKITLPGRSRGAGFRLSEVQSLLT